MRSTSSSEGPRAARGPRAAAAIAFAVAAAGVASAHDFWLEPSSWSVPAGELVRLRLLVGERLAGSEVPRDERRIVRFVDRGPRETTAIVGRDGYAPAGLLRPDDPGLHVVGYQSTPAFLELEAPRFEAYLREEGLEEVIDARATRGEAELPGRERYVRCAKALVTVGDAAPAGAERPLGLELELVAEGDPLTDASGRFRLLHQGEPLAGALVVVLAAEAPDAPSSARSDAEGRVTLPLPASGMVLVKAVHMVRVTDGDPRADWQSLWASLSFGRGSPAAAAHGDEGLDPPGAR